ncbi:histidine phosphatase family protein [Secundilactobacillus yichangensis]|uniref:histidine phosphatase family protein n=1 Tax=Secundilactobacillus yichangensis TaxID=2799580 RepID=UPI0019435D53|nr:histidine phosphatase family protein [Secundilactobacillus yichangensis]
MTTQTVYIVRHGQTLLNRFNRMQGWCDSDLTKQGRLDALSAGKKLKGLHFNYVYSSDLKRAIDTRDIILSEQVQPTENIIVEPLFREVFFGYFEGLDADETWAKVGAPHGFKTQEEILKTKGFIGVRQYMNDLDPEHLAETNEQVLARWKQGFDTIRNTCSDNSSVLLVTHGTFIRTLADSQGVNTIGNYPANGSISTVKLTDDNTTLISYNKTSL